MLALSQLVTPISEDDALASILSILSETGLQTTSWQSGGAQLVTLRLFARVWSKFSSVLALIAAGGFTTLAASTDGASDFLTLLARYVYKLERVAPQNTIGTVLFTSSAGAPTHTFAAGDLIIANAANGTDGAVTLTCISGGTINPGTTLQVQFQADVAGAAGNLPPNTPLYFWTPLVGVTATNPALVPDSTTWITTVGQDEETDARLLDRCLGRWERLMYGNTDGAYRGWALEALPALTRLSIKRAAGDGTVQAIGATAVGGLTGGQITTVQDFVNGVTDGTGRRPTNDIFTMASASVVSPALGVTAYVTDAAKGTAPNILTTKLLTFIGQQPIGGTKIKGGGYVLFDDLLDVVKQAIPRTLMRSVELSISDDIPLLEGQIYQPSINVTIFTVAPGA